MPLTLRDAAKSVGRDRTTLLRAIKSGTLSASRDAATNAWLIEPAELHRVYPPAERTGDSHGAAQPRTPDAQDADLRARLADAQATIDDLRRRLDAAEQARQHADAERRQAQERLTALLTDQRAPVRRTWRFWLPWRR